LKKPTWPNIGPTPPICHITHWIESGAILLYLADNEARELVGFDRFLHVQAWLNRGLARPAVQRGLQVTAG
jgi:glutathione S-transferase